MCNELKNSFIRKVNLSKEKQKTCGILLVGSFKDKYINDDFESEGLSDIDLFLVTEKDGFEREVVNFEGIEFDISYINKKQIEKALEEEVHSLIAVLGKSEILEADDETRMLIDKVKEVYKRGPEMVDKYHADYRRFVLTGYLQNLEKRMERLEFHVLLNGFIKEILEFYYTASGMWIPPEKNLLKFIEDSNILYILEEIYKEKDRSIKIELAERLFDSIMGPFGGRLKYWEKGEYPFDFEN